MQVFLMVTTEVLKNDEKGGIASKGKLKMAPRGTQGNRQMEQVRKINSADWLWARAIGISGSFPGSPWDHSVFGRVLLGRKELWSPEAAAHSLEGLQE